MESKKKVLIVGASAKEYVLAKYFAGLNYIEKVYIAPGNEAAEEFAQRIDIREDSVSELLEFAIKNDINLTVASSQLAIKSDIAGHFAANSQPIFAPTADCANFATSRGYSKKFLYKLHIPTPKFGIFEKQQLATDYINSADMPLLITTDRDIEKDVRSVCTTINLAKTCINDIFFRNEDKVVIENYVYGHPFTFYIITDGYQALPLGVAGDYKFQEDGDAGLFTLGVGAFVPDYKVSFDIISDLMKNVIEKILLNLQKRETPYLGILGVECVLTKPEQYTVTGFTPFFKDHDAQALVNSLDIDLYYLMQACSNGSFADDYDNIPIKDVSIISCVLTSNKEDSIISGLELVDDTTDIAHFDTAKNSYLEWLTNKGRTLVITQTAGTFTRARELMYDNISDIYFDGMKYRSDICAEYSDINQFN